MCGCTWGLSWCGLDEWSWIRCRKSKHFADESFIRGVVGVDWLGAGVFVVVVLVDSLRWPHLLFGSIFVVLTLVCVLGCQGV